MVFTTFSIGLTGITFAEGSLLAGMTAAGAAATIMGVTTLITSGIGMLMTKGLNVGAGNFGMKATIRGAANPRQLIYGETVVGGTLVFVKTSGTDNNSLHMIVALAGHEINAISEVRLNGEALTTSTSTISSTTVHTVTSANYTNTANDNSFGSGRLVRFTKHLGASDQTYDIYAAAQIGAAWTSAHRLRGIAYVYIQCIYDNEKFTGGVPTITAKVQGKKVYDPRTSTTVFSANPALCLRDYLLDTQNGLGALSTEINDSASVSGGFVTAANICDQDVDDVGSSAEDRYTMNGFFNTEGEPASIIESMLSSCAGKVAYSNGQFNLFAGAAQTPTLTITDDDILSPIDIMTQPDTANLFNGVKAIYVDKNNKYQAADIPIHLNSTYLSADTPSGGQTANYEKYMELQFPYTLSESTAQRLARIGLKSNRQTTTVTLTVNLKFYQLQVGDWVRITNSRMSWTNKYFEVMALGFDSVGDGDNKFLAVQLILQETENDVFAFDTDNDYVGAVAVGGDQPTTGISITAPTNLALTASASQGIIHWIKATWTPAVAATIQNTEVYYKVTGANDNTYILAATTNREATTTTIHGLNASTSYSVRARHKGRFGNYSAYTSVVTVTTGAGGVDIDNDDDFMNTSMSLDLSGTSLTLTNGGGSAQTFSNSSVGLGNVADVDMRNLSNATGGTVAVGRGGTGASNLNGVENTRVQLNTDGSLNYANSGSGNPTMNTLEDANNVRARVTTGMNSSGYVTTGINSGGNVSVADIKDAKVRATTGLNASGYVTTGIYSGGNVTAADLKDSKGRAFAGLAANGDVARTVGKNKGGLGTDVSSATGVVRFASGTLNTDSALSTTYTDATDNGTTINTSGNITGNMSVGATLTLGTSSGNKIVCGNVVIDGEEGRILIND